MMPYVARALAAAPLVVCFLFATAPTAAANIAPPGWAFVSVHAVLEAGRFAAPTDAPESTAGYRFFIRDVELEEVRSGERLRLRTGPPTSLVAIPAARFRAWKKIRAAHESLGAALRVARERIPGFATTRIRARRDLRPASTPRQTLHAAYRIVAIEGGAIRFEIGERRVDGDGRPIGRTALLLLGIATLGLTGLVLTVVRRRRTGSEAT